jgi:peptidoglycan-associated lipoprotein
MSKVCSYALVLVMAVSLLAACAKRADLGQGPTGTIGPTPVTSAAPSFSTAPGGAGDAAAGRSSVLTESVVSRPVGPTVTTTAAPPAAEQAAGPLKDIFFDFDKDVIRDDQKAVLDANAAWLKSHPGVRTTLEGHADERGTNEYNLALGDRRAKTTRDYLVAKGVEPSRLSIVSYGEERPFVLGHDEAAWRWNRRAHFVVSGR